MIRLLRISLALLTSFAAAFSAGAETLHFEDVPASNDSLAVVGEEYAHFGVHFSTDDGSIWDGASVGDPGGWGLEGTDGPTFLGFDGASYSLTASFDTPVLDFQLDVAAADSPLAGWGFDQFILVGSRDGFVVDSAHVVLGEVDEWATVTLLGEVDEISWVGGGPPGMRFGVDRLDWFGSGPGPVDEPMRVDCDLKPGNDANIVNPKSRGVVPLVLYGAEDFDVLEVDPESLGLGPAGAPPAHRNGPHAFDQDADGYLDLLIHHNVSAAELPADADEACLSGVTWSGVEFEACDHVTFSRKR
jgi:hypothetical protein